MANASAGQRAAIVASFAVQAGLILAAISILTGNASPPASPPLVPALPSPPAPVATPSPSASITQPPAPRSGPVIGVSVTAAGQQGSTDYPSPVEPIMWVPAESGVVVTVTLTIPQGSVLGSFQIGMTNGAWAGVPDHGAALVTSGRLRPGQYTYTLHLTAADLPSVDGNFLVLTGQAYGDPALTAPLADFITGQQPQP